jgi:hypothetical protein
MLKNAITAKTGVKWEMANIDPAPKPPLPKPPLPALPPVPPPWKSREEYAKYLVNLRFQAIERLNDVCVALTHNLESWGRSPDTARRPEFEGYISRYITLLDGIMPTLRHFNIEHMTTAADLWPHVVKAWNAVAPGAPKDKQTVATTLIHFKEFRHFVEQLRERDK